jgi:riboflavin synthase
MFSGIIEAIGVLTDKSVSGKNILFTIRSPLSEQLMPGQSVAHDGVCLTITEVHGQQHQVMAIDETLQKTRLYEWTTGTLINLERSLTVTSLLNGHLVQGHVDTVARCSRISEESGSRLCHFHHAVDDYFITVPKGSVCVNGVSLTVVDAGPDFFSVALIPYTLEHTNLKELRPGSRVNVEFDIIGKYIRRLMKGST